MRVFEYCKTKLRGAISSPAMTEHTGSFIPDSLKINCLQPGLQLKCWKGLAQLSCCVASPFPERWDAEALLQAEHHICCFICSFPSFLGSAGRLYGLERGCAMLWFGLSDGGTWSAGVYWVMIQSSVYSDVQMRSRISFKYCYKNMMAQGACGVHCCRYIDCI